MAHEARRVSLLLTLPVGMVRRRRCISLALALPALRVRGEYFVAASLGLQMLAVTVFAEWKSVTGGIGGLIAIPPARLFRDFDGHRAGALPGAALGASR